jgi:hypothetical protein
MNADDFNEAALDYLAPVHHSPSLEDAAQAEIDAENTMRIDEQVTNTINSLPGNSPSPDKYRYKDGIADGVKFNKDQDKGVDLPNTYIKPLSINMAGYDLVDGKKHTNRFEDKYGYVLDGVTQLGKSKFNTQAGAPITDVQGLSRIAYTAVTEGKDYNYFLQSVPDAWPEHQKQLAWQAAQAAEIRDRYENGEIDLDAVPASDGPLIEGEYSEDDLLGNEHWMNDIGQIYQYFEGEAFRGNPIELHEWATHRMSRLNAPTWGGNLLARSWFAPDPVKQALYRVLTVYEGTDLSWSQFGRGLMYGVADPTNLVSLVPGGLAATAATKATQKIAMQKLRNVLIKSMAGTAVGVTEGAVYAGLDDFYKQAIAVNAGAQEDYDIGHIASSAGKGAAFGGFLGFGLGGAMTPEALEFGRMMLQKGKENLQAGSPAIPGMPSAQGGHLGPKPTNDMPAMPTPEELQVLGPTQLARIETGIAESFNVSPEANIASPRQLATQPKNAAISPDASVPPTVEVGKFIEQKALEANQGKVLDIVADKEVLSDKLATEALSAMKLSTKNAAEWYRNTLNTMRDIVSTKHPEIKDDVGARTAFHYALATTSNGTKVSDNAKFADQAYTYYKNHGKFPESFPQGGKEAQAMANSFKLWNKGIEQYGQDTFIKILNSDFTIKELKTIGLIPDAKGEKAEAILPGSVAMGPKIGGGFFTNLQGRWDLPTFDMWWMRTIGRLTGKLMNEQKPEHLTGIREQIEAQPELFEQYGGTPEILESDDALADWTLRAFGKWAREGHPDKENKFFKLIRSISNNRKSIDAPAGGQQREDMRALVTRTLEKLAEKEETIDSATLQALVWFPEQTLWDHLGSRQTGKENDYAKAFNTLFTGTVPGYSGTTGTVSSGAGGRGIPQSDARPVFTEGERTKFVQAETARNIRPEYGHSPTGSPSESGTYTGKSAGRTTSARWVSANGREITAPVAKIHKPAVKTANDLNTAKLNAAPFLELQPSKESSRLFHRAITASTKGNKFGKSVYVYPEKDYSDMKLFVTENGKSGFAVKPDGDIVSVFSSEPGSAYSMLFLATQSGGRKLDAFNTVLPGLYAAAGYRPVSKVKWSDEAMPEGWDKSLYKDYNNGEPDVVAFIYDPNYKGYKVQEDIKNLEYSQDYDTMMSTRDALLEPEL